jgi:hypothetical protein
LTTSTWSWPAAPTPSTSDLPLSGGTRPATAGSAWLRAPGWRGALMAGLELRRPRAGARAGRDTCQ